MSEKWFDRKFEFNVTPGDMPAVISRLEATMELIRKGIEGLTNEQLENKPDGKWSVKEHIAHLAILEQLWRVRFEDIKTGKEVLSPADLENRATTQGDFNTHNISNLINWFEDERMRTVQILRSISDEDHQKSSLHPRLQKAMRIVDLAWFVAEHDEHHLRW